MTFDCETNDYALSDCAWWDEPITKRPSFFQRDCSGRVGDTHLGVLCEGHFNAIPSDCYVMESVVNGEPEPNEFVDRAYVDRYLDAASFFEGLGGFEHVENNEDDGTIKVRSSSPDEKVNKVVTFTVA